jgi:hypothetical protein
MKIGLKIKKYGKILNLIQKNRLTNKRTKLCLNLIYHLNNLLSYDLRDEKMTLRKRETFGKDDHKGYTTSTCPADNLSADIKLYLKRLRKRKKFCPNCGGIIPELTIIDGFNSYNFVCIGIEDFYSGKTIAETDYDSLREWLISNHKREH